MQIGGIVAVVVVVVVAVGAAAALFFRRSQDDEHSVEHYHRQLHTLEEFNRVDGPADAIAHGLGNHGEGSALGEKEVRSLFVSLVHI